jgi:hypothetical protein
MNNHILRTVGIGAGLASVMFAQSFQRQATFVGGGGPDRGKCTVEVVVDVVAEVEIRGASATLRNISGQPAQWRRFECTGPLPANPGNFRFTGVDGRGRQDLVRDPRSGGTAVIRIEDKDGGSEGYTFDINWDTRGPDGPVTGGNAPNYPDRDQGRPNERDSDYYRRYGHGFGVDEAVRVCQQSVVAQVSRQFRTNEVHFERTSIDDRPGRNDWVIGTLDIHRGRREERYGFSCSVNFENGRVRSAELDPQPLPDGDRRRY